MHSCVLLLASSCKCPATVFLAKPGMSGMQQGKYQQEERACVCHVRLEITVIRMCIFQVFDTAVYRPLSGGHV